MIHSRLYYLGIFLYVGFFVTSCTKQASISAQLISERLGDEVKFTVLLTSNEPADLELYSDIDESLLLGSLTHTFTEKREFILTDRDSSKMSISLTPGAPYIIKFSGHLVELNEGRIKLDFGSMGYIEGALSDRVNLGVVVFPDLEAALGRDEGIPSNSIEIVLIL